MPELRKRPAPKETATPAPVAKRSASKARAGVGATEKAKKVAGTVKGAAVAGGDGKKDEGKDGDEGATATAADVDAPVSEKGVVSGATEEEAGKEKAKAKGKSTATAGNEGIKGPLNSESVGKKINTEGFGGTVKTHSGDDVALSGLIERSEKGVVLFTYPKASTPGCTTQACLFRDSYAPLQAAGLSVYGLSTDSPKANTTFATKQKLPFDLLCDPDAGLTGALGLKKSQGKGTLRGSVVISKDGTVEVWNQAGPAKTLEVVTQWIEGKK